MMEEKRYPVSEKFVEVQGEGQFVGCRMAFIRLAGCTVGRPFPKEQYIAVRYCKNCSNSESAHSEATFKRTVCDNFQVGREGKALPIYTEQCTLYDDRKFPCDSDYRVKERLTIGEILDWIPQDINHVCITGGEPMMHDLGSLLNGIDARLHREGRNGRIHLETSGTIGWERAFSPRQPWQSRVWVTVSPKKGCLPEMIARANEIKLLVDADFNSDRVPVGVVSHPLVYIHPVNGERTVNVENLRRCRELQDRFPNWRLGAQFHKVLEHFLQERVR